MSSPLSTPTIDLTLPHGPAHSLNQNSQTTHRLNILNSWNISPSSKIIEIGCGQGYCTTVLASLIGPEGHIDAIDPAPLNYGSPSTLGEAQARISRSEIGDRVSWHQSPPFDFLKNVPEGTYDVAVFVHSGWYFASPTELRDTFAMLRGKSRYLCIAEYSLSATEKGAIPHVLAALARTSLEVYNKNSEANIRNAFSPKALRRMAEDSGWALASERTIVPEEALDDGGWEVKSVLGEGFLEEADEVVGDERVRIVLDSMREAVRAAVSNLVEGQKVRTMDVWIARFE
jgi:SAM-dependent methyltransferase